MSMAMNVIDGSPKKTFHMQSFDILRGISIILMLIAHIQHYWLVSEDLWLIGFIFIALNFHGTSGFTFVAGLGLGFTWIRKKEQKFSKKHRTITSLSHSIILLGFSVCFNVISASVRKNAYWFEFIWYWNILQCIVMSRFLGILLIRLKKVVQIIIVCSFWFIGSYLSFQLVPINEVDSNFYLICYYIFINPLHANSILVYLPFFMMGAWLGEDICKLKIKLNFAQEYDSNAIKNWRKKWIIISSLTFLCALLLGFPSSDLDYGWNLLDMINKHPSIDWVGLPIWLIPNSYAWVLTCISVQIGLTLLFSIRYDFTTRHHHIKFLMRYGKYSLTIYFGHYILLFLPWLVQKFSYLTIWVPMISYILLIGFIVYLIDRNKKNYYMIEPIIRRSAKFFIKKMGL